MRRPNSVIILLLILLGVYSLAFETEKVRAIDSIYIRADGSIDPPTAPISTFDNVTYILTSNIISDSYGIIIERSNIVLRGDGYSVEGSGDLAGLAIISQRNVTIEEVNVTEFGVGIHLSDAFNNTVIDSRMENNTTGLSIKNSSNNSIMGNYIENNIAAGIQFISYTNSNSISRNSILNCYRGIQLGYLSCYYNIISENNITDNEYFGIHLRRSSNNTIHRNNIRTNNSHQEGRGIGLEDRSDNNIITENNIAGYVLGIRVKRLSYQSRPGSMNLISGNKITNTRDGIGLSDSHNNIISGNHIVNNNSSGFYINNANFTIVQGNNLTGNRYGGSIGWYSSNNSVFQNIFRSNTDVGLILIGSSNTIFENNIISNARALNVESYSPANNNMLYSNNFVNNTEQAYVENDLGNIWDTGYPYGGNYWSNYTCVDLFSGPFQNETGGDGIGDYPYVIDENNQDNYPLIYEWVPPLSHNSNFTKGGVTYSIVVISNATIVDFMENLGIMKLKVSGDTGASGYARIIQSVGLNSTNIKVFLNNTKLTVPSTVPPRSISTNGTHYFIYFAFTFNSSYELTIGFPIVGDVDYNGVVDIFDVVKVALAYGSNSSDSNWDAHCDVAEEYGIIDIFDVVIVVTNYGEEWS